MDSYPKNLTSVIIYANMNEVSGGWQPTGQILVLLYGKELLVYEGK